MIKKIVFEDCNALQYKYLKKHIAKIKRIIQQGNFILGDDVTEFERSFADWNQSKYCIGVNSGLDALIIGIKILNLQPYSEVIVASNTYIASILAIIHAGLTPVLVDPDPETCNICPKNIEEAITNKTVAVLVTHLYGHPCKMTSIMNIVKKYSIKLIEDCAQAHGAEYNRIKVGNFGIGCFSFYPTKNLGGCGDGGAITVNSKILAERAFAMRNYGKDKKGKFKYVGYNSRMQVFQAAVLSNRLIDLESVNERKRQIAKMYISGISSPIELPIEQPDCKAVYHIFNIRTKYRNDLKNFLTECGIQTLIHYPTPPYREYSLRGLKYKSKLSDLLHKNTISLPIHINLKEEEIKYIINKVNLWARKKL